MTLRRVNDFETSDKEKLSEQLSRMEDNVAREFGRFPARLTWLDWVATFPAQASYDCVFRADTASAAAAVGITMPSVSAESVSRPVGIVRRGAQNVILYPVDVGSLIDGAASATLASDGLYLYMHDGVTWYRV